MAPTPTNPNTVCTVEGVRIACAGECDTGIDLMTNTNIPVNHDVFAMGELCPVSELVGMPFLVSKVRPSLQYAATRPSYNYELNKYHYPNGIIEKLMIYCDEALVNESNGQGALLETPKRWMQNVGSVVLARKDHKPLYAHHVRMLLRFMWEVCSGLANALDDESFLGPGSYDLGFSLDIPAEISRRCEVAALFNPGDFKEFYMEQRRAWEHESDLTDLLDLPSPWTPGSDAATRYYWQLDEYMVKRLKIPVPADAAKPDRILWTRRNLDRKAYRETSKLPIGKRLANAQSWRESQLLTEIAVLKKLLCKKCRGNVADVGF